MTRRVIAAGMPNSGKSTFIAALTHLLSAGQVPTKLTLSRLSEDEGHLSRLEAIWLAASKLERTKKPTECWVTFHVKSDDGFMGELLVPDLRGELFEQPVVTGRCPRHFWEAICDSDGLLLFTNADFGCDDLMVQEADNVIDGFDEVDSDQETTKPKIEEFNPSRIPEEAKLVELLQAINRGSNNPKKRRLALIISAWDVVGEAAKDDPSRWLEANRPMLAQYLRHNSEAWCVRIFGVSAQGGELPRQRSELKKIRRPGERINVVGIGEREHDLTAIIHWLISPHEPAA